METREDWHRLISKQERSGCSISTWCQEHGVNSRKFYYWRKRLQTLSSPEKSKREFIRIDRSEPLELLIGEKLRIKLPLRFDIAEVKRLLEAVGC